jgi:hypothetical protein
MNHEELEIERAANLEYLNSILSAYRSAERKSKKTLGIIFAMCVIAVYFLFFDLLGGIWGYIATIAILAVGAYCFSKVGISFQNNTVSDGKLAHQACVTMEKLIAIKKGTFRQYGAHIITTGSGKHHDLYMQFIQFYPECASIELERLSKVEVDKGDIFNGY